MIYIADTHSLVWHLSGNPSLSATVRSAFQEADAQIVIPFIVLAEIAFLHARGRIAVDVTTILDYVNRTANCRVYSLDAAIIQRMPTTLEMHDAIIVATALILAGARGDEAALVTRDRDITASGLVNVIW